MPKYVSTKAGPHRSVIYTDSLGKQWQFLGGNRPWRNQNPGNLVPGKVSKRNGAIGKADKFAVFPDYEAGHAALLDSLKNEHAEKISIHFLKYSLHLTKIRPPSMELFFARRPVSKTKKVSFNPTKSRVTAGFLKIGVLRLYSAAK